MDFDTYDEWADIEIAYIGSLIEQEGLNAVLQTCYEEGRENLVDFSDVRSMEIGEFFSTPHPLRERFLARFQTNDRHLFLVCAMHRARCASLLLERMCKYGVTGSSGAAKSMILLQAAVVAEEVAAELPKLYPFAEDGPLGLNRD